jgi:hypothetical protein
LTCILDAREKFARIFHEGCHPRHLSAADWNEGKLPLLSEESEEAPK